MPGSERSGRLRSLILFGAIAATSPALVIAADPVAPFDCIQGVCGFNVTARDLRVAPCEDRPVLVAYSQGGGATLIQCSARTDAAGNLSYLFDRHARGSGTFELAGTRFIKPDFLAEAVVEGVPDRFGALPLCAKLAPSAAVTGEILLVSKTLKSNADGAYCYRLLRAGTASGRLTIQADSGEAPAISKTANMKWAALASRILPHIKGNAPASAGRMARVVQVKAPLFETPDADASSRAYLVEGDSVQLLDQSKSASGWLRVRFITKAGQKIDRWIQSAALTKAMPESIAH